MFKGNKIYKVDKNGKKRRVFFIKGLKVRFKGKNSNIIIHEPCIRFRHCSITCKDNCQIIIDSSSHSAKKLGIAANASNFLCKIGKEFSCTNGCFIQSEHSSDIEVIIGDNCMFGSNIVLRSTDSHSIIDIESGNIINYAENIIIGDNVWLAANVTLLKGVKIASGAVIGYGSIVTKNCETPNSIYAGIPAKLVKKDISWDRKPPMKLSY